MCWGPNGRVHVRGRLFADSPADIRVSARFTFSGVAGGTTVTRTAQLFGRNAASRLVFLTEGDETTRFTAVRIQLSGPNGLAYDGVETR